MNRLVTKNSRRQVNKRQKLKSMRSSSYQLFFNSVVAFQGKTGGRETVDNMPSIFEAAEYLPRTRCFYKKKGYKKNDTHAKTCLNCKKNVHLAFRESILPRIFRLENSWDALYPHCSQISATA